MAATKLPIYILFRQKVNGNRRDLLQNFVKFNVDKI